MKTKMKGLTTICTITALAASLIAPNAAGSTKAASEEANLESGRENQPELVFPVISDVHIKKDGTADLSKFRTALLQLNRLAPHQDALAVVGDLTDNGAVEEYDRFMSLYQKYKQPDTVSLFAMGNHDYWNGLSPADAQERFIQKTGVESIYYHKVVKGYHFIMLSPEEGKTHGHFSKKQIAWLDEQLKQAKQDDPGKPIFVFLHQHIKDTVYGSDEWGTQDNKELLYDTLDDYPQVVTFSGHSHYSLDDPRSIHQKHFTSAGTGSLAYMELESGKVQGNIPEGAGNIQQGLLVEVYQNQVVINRRDFHNNEWTGTPWVVKLPSKTNKFKYTEDRDDLAPKFPASASIQVEEEETTATGMRVKFSQAQDDLMVHTYQVTATNTKTGEVDKQFQAFSEFYYDPMPETLSFLIDGLKPATTYDIEVEAIDSFGNASAENLHATGKTQSVVLTSASANPEVVEDDASTIVQTTLKNYGEDKAAGTLKLDAPDGWTVQPAEQTFELAGNEEKTFDAQVKPPKDYSGLGELTVTAKAGSYIQTSKVGVYANMKLGENFEELKPVLKPAVDEKIPASVLGWTHTAPSGWSVETQADMPQGMTEWQGWSFATKEFWASADKQERENFKLGSGIVAIADPDEWDDHGSPAAKGYFNSTLISPVINVVGGQELFLGFASHYRQEGGQTATVEVTFDNGQKQQVLLYNSDSNSDNNGRDMLNKHEIRKIQVPDGASSMTIHWKMSNAQNNWFWAIDDVRVDDQPVTYTQDQ